MTEDEMKVLALEMIATFHRWVDLKDGDDALAATSPEAMAIIRPLLRPK